MTDDNVTPFRVHESPDELRGAIEQLKRHADTYIEHCRFVARIKYEYVCALKKEGFTDAQALELAKASILL